MIFIYFFDILRAVKGFKYSNSIVDFTSNILGTSQQFFLVFTCRNEFVGIFSSLVFVVILVIPTFSTMNKFGKKTYRDFIIPKL